MNTASIETMISGFLQRKDEKFPELELFGRNETRTVKYDI
jgi:hypothetical protein